VGPPRCGGLRRMPGTSYSRTLIFEVLGLK